MQSTAPAEKGPNPLTLRQSTIELKAEASIKRSNIKGFLNAGIGSMEVNLMDNDQNSHLNDHLLQLKTSCSGVKMEIKNKEIEQSRYKDETLHTSEKVKVIQQQKFKLEDEIQKLKTTVEQVKSKKLAAHHSFKSYQHILDRMKKDEIKAQLKRNDLEKQLKCCQKQFKELDLKTCDLKEYECLSYNGLKEAHEEINDQNSLRKKKLNNMNSVLGEKHVIQKKKQDRRDKTDMIKEMAAGDLQDADLIRMKKFLKVQLFFKCMLKNKIESLKTQYEPYEIAFLKIKSSTGVKDAGSLISEYSNFQTSYTERSEWVKHLEAQITRLQEIKKENASDYKKQKQRELQILESIEQKSDTHDSMSRRQLIENSEICELKMMQIKEWIKAQIKRTKLEIDPSASDAQNFNKICLHLITKIQPEQKTNQLQTRKTEAQINASGQEVAAAI